MNNKMPLFIKRVIEHPTIYIVVYTKAIELPYIIFIQIPLKQKDVFS